MPRTPFTLRRAAAAQLLGATVAFLGGTVLLTWYIRTLNLVTLPGSFVRMEYTTALGFIVTGLAVVAHSMGRTRLAFWGGAVAGGVGSLALAEEVLGRSFGLTALLLGESVSSSETGHMSSLTAVCFAVSGCLIIAMQAPWTRQRWRRRSMSSLAAVLVAAGFVGLLGFSLNDGASYGWAHLTDMEAHTALGFVGLGIALFVMMGRYPGGSMLDTRLPDWAPWAIGGGVAALTASLWISLNASDGRVRTLAVTKAHEATVAHTNQILQQYVRTLSRMAGRWGGLLPEDQPRLVADARALMRDVPGLTGVARMAADGSITLVAVAEDEPWDPAADVPEHAELRSVASHALREQRTCVTPPVEADDGRYWIDAAAPVGDGTALLFRHGVRAFFDGILREGMGRAFDVELSLPGERPFYCSYDEYAAPREQLAARQQTGDASGRIALGDQVWTLRAAADQAWIAGGRGVANTLLLWFGLFLALAIAFVVRKSELVRQRAASLSDAKVVIEEHANSLRLAAQEKRRVLDSLSAFLIGVDGDGRVVEWNRVSSDLFGLPSEPTLGQRFDELPIPWDRALVAEAVQQALTSVERVRRDNLALEAEGQPRRILSLTVSPTADAGGFSIIGSDVTERQLLEAQLHQAQRLEAVGTLAAGIAHEINTPMQYVGDNLRFVAQNVGPMVDLLREVPAVMQAARAELSPGGAASMRVAGLAEAAEKLDVDFVAAELPNALKETLEGVERVTTIVRAMKDFSHPGTQGRKAADVNKAIQTTVHVARNEYKYVADVETDFGELPQVDCWVADLNQVFLNLLVNAAHAIKDCVAAGRYQRGTIRITTRLDGDVVDLRFSDTGAGIPEAVRGRIFDQFFTTKEPGRGTGLGLAIARAVVVEKHHGDLSFETELEVGTTFVIRLPVRGTEEQAGQASAVTEGAGGESPPDLAAAAADQLRSLSSPASAGIS